MGHLSYEGCPNDRPFFISVHTRTDRQGLSERSNMNRTVAVNGTGKLSLSPDLTEVSVTLRSTDKSYDKMMGKASEALEAVQEALASLGFDKKDLTTSSLNIQSEYDYSGSNGRKFIGYSCFQSMTLEFGFDTDRLSGVLKTLASCIADPELTIRFSLRDREAASEKLLEMAAENARKKAGILAKASGVKLGELVSINYRCSDFGFNSMTDYCVEEACCNAKQFRAMGITPADIELSDSAEFVWNIE